jgi:hypothetical protein
VLRTTSCLAAIHDEFDGDRTSALDALVWGFPQFGGTQLRGTDGIRGISASTRRIGPASIDGRIENCQSKRHFPFSRGLACGRMTIRVAHNPRLTDLSIFL